MNMEDKILAIYEIVYRTDKNQSVLLEKFESLRTEHNRLVSRVEHLEDKTQGIMWFKQTRSVLLWMAALVGSGSSFFLLLHKLF